MNTIKYYRAGRPDQNKVTLTFDDGPSPGITEQVAEVLESYGVRGTFFVVGQWVAAPGGEETVRRLMKGNHIIGNHTVHHYNPATSTIPYPLTEFTEAEAIISKVLGGPTRYGRAPYLAYKPYVCDALAAWVGDRKIIDTEVWAYDWENWRSPTKTNDIIHAMLDSPKLGAGTILLMHDGSELEEERRVRPLPMIKALPAIIEGVRARGLEIVGLDEMEFDESSTVALSCDE